MHFTDYDYVLSVDEFERDEVFCIAYVLLNKSQADSITKKWTKLQKKIKSEIISRGGKSSQDIRLSGEKLPEIHAERLTQSGDYYRWREADKHQKDYWMIHFDWLEEALKIIRHASPQIFVSGFFNFREEIEDKLKHVEILVRDEIKSTHKRKMYTEFLNSVKNPYGIVFCGSIFEMDSYFFENNKKAKVICDNYDQCKGFSSLEYYDVLRKNGHFNNLSAPEFLDSEDEALIQVADVVAYVMGQIDYQRYCEKNGTYKDDFKSRFYKKCAEKYLMPFNKGGLVAKQDKPDYINEVRTIMLMELVSKNANLSSSLSEAIQNEIASKSALIFPK